MTIIEDGRGVVFERVLTDDQVVELLLDRPAIDAEPQPGNVRLKPASVDANSTEPKPCCGSRGRRHMRHCKQYAVTAQADTVYKKDTGAEEDGTLNSPVASDISDTRTGLATQLIEDGPPMDPKSRRVQELIRNGHDDDFIASEIGVSVQSVKFIRRALQKREEQH